MTHERLTLRCTDEINWAVDALCDKSESRIEKLLVTPQNLGVKDIVDRSWFEHRSVLEKLKSRLAKITPTCCSVCHKPTKVICDVCDVTLCEDHTSEDSGLCDHCGVYFCHRCDKDKFIGYSHGNCRSCGDALPSTQLCT